MCLTKSSIYLLNIVLVQIVILIRVVIVLTFMQQLQCVKAGKLLPEIPALSLVS